jgi:hypothetical protein
MKYGACGPMDSDAHGSNPENQREMENKIDAYGIKTGRQARRSAALWRSVASQPVRSGAIEL